MTREEALRRVKGYLTDIIPAEDYSEVEEILKALEPEPCDDAISRQYLLDNCIVDRVTMPYVPVSKIENAPPVIPQQKMGMWIVNKQLGGRYQCSQCGMFSGLDSKDIEEGYELPNFCSNCGIKMRKVEK